jgi:Holliday junction resolvase RusA-like endonuclease
MLYLCLPINPVPASRPRVSRWGTYYGKRHTACRSKTKALLTEMRDNGTLPSVLLTGRLVVWVVFQVEKPKTSKLVAPRGDIDNYAKLLFDCCTQHVWVDDIQIDIMSARKVWADGGGRTDLWIKELK